MEVMQARKRCLFFLGPLPPMQASLLWPFLADCIHSLFPHKEKEKNVTSEWASFAWWLMVSQNPRILALSLVQRMNVNNFSPVVSQGIYILLLQSIKNWVTFPHKFQRSQHSKSWKGLFWQMTHHKNERKRLNLELGCNWRYLPLLQAKITSICTILAINTAMNVAIST